MGKWRPTKKGEVPAFDSNIRKINGKSKGWIDTRVVTSESRLIRQLTLHEWALYAFLCVVADSKGISWYSLDKISELLHMGKDMVIKARKGLQEKGLINFASAEELARKYPELEDIDRRYTFCQVLELPIAQLTIEYASRQTRPNGIREGLYAEVDK